MQVLKDEIRERILHAAVQEFREKGFVFASTREIALEAGISKGNLYNYFRSKEELFYAVTASFYRLFNSFIRQIFSHPGKEEIVLGNTEILSAKIAEFIKLHRDEFIIIMNRSGGTKYASFKEETVSLLKNHFSENLKVEIIKTSGPELLIMHIIARNFLEALISIAEGYRDDSETVNNIILFLNYHISGVKQFY